MAKALKSLWVFALGASVLGFTPAQAQQPARGAAGGIDVPAGRWNLEYGRARCTLTRRVAGEGSPILIVSTRPDFETAEVMLITDADRALPDLPRRGQLVLLPGGTSTDVRVMHLAGHGRRAASIDGVPPDFLDQLAGASGLQISGRNKDGLTVQTPDARQAVAAVRACNQDLLRSWGIDVDQQARMSRPPTHVAGGFVDTDYPAAAINRSQAGTTFVRYTVRADGSVGDCRIIFTSRVPLLDATTCQLITARFRYSPALDAHGNPAPYMLVERVRWGIVDDAIDGFFPGTTFAVPGMGIAN